MGDLFKRPTFTREISGIGRTPDISVPEFTNTRLLPTAEGEAPQFTQDLGQRTVQGGLQPFTRTASYKGASTGLSALADFLTAFGGPRGFGSGIPIAAELQQQRNQAPTRFFQQQQEQADVGTQRTLQMHQLQQQEEQMNMPLISINQDTGKVTFVDKRKILSGDVAGGVKIFEPKKMTSEDFHHFIKGIETDYGVTFTPDEIFAISQSADNPKQLQTVAVKIMQEKQQAKRATDAAAEAERRRLQNEIAQNARLDKSIAAIGQRQDKALAAIAARNTGDARMDKSYQFNAPQIVKLRAPIEAQQERIARLQASIDQKTPQSDALIAPELLTAMAGGMGSGLRMNEAEIARIVKGRSNWESLKAALNKWRSNPEAVSITDSQREQIKSLVNATQERITKQLNAIDEGAESLIEAASVEAHRRIVNQVRERLADINAGGKGQIGTKSISSKDPLGILK